MNKYKERNQNAMSTEYHSRIVDSYFKKRMLATGALLIEGPKWCGKTRTSMELCSSALFLQDPDNLELNLHYAKTKPSKLLEGEKPRLIDEWQVAPVLWNAVRFSIDNSGERGQYLLTGSAVPHLDADESNMLHSGTGRIARVCMRTMSLYELGYSNGSVSLAELFKGKDDFDAVSDLSIEDLAYAICCGGWPSNLDLDGDVALQTPRDYVESVVLSDISRADGVLRNPDTARRIMASFARNICSIADMTVIMKDVGDSADRNTVRSYIDALKMIFVIEDIPAWSPATLSKTRIRASVKRNFTDSSIATAVLNIGPESLMKDMPSFGQFFESLCVRDLRVYSQVLNGRVFHYHDNSNLEVDMIVELDDGSWGAMEVKLTSGEEKAASNLLRLRNKIRLVNGKNPSFLAIVTGTGFFRKRDDGVLVIPIGCLKD